MKVSTALCALNLYTLALGAPIPTSHNGSAMNPTTSIREVLHRIHAKASMGERMSIKGFLRHRLDSHHVASEDIAMHRPLSTSELKSLVSDLDSQTPIPEREQSSTVRAEAGYISRTNPTTVEEEVAGSRRLYRFMPCQRSSGGKQQYHLVRQYADMVVVGVLAVFLMAVAVVELWTPVSRRLRQWHNKEGAICLGDEKTPMGPSQPAILQSPLPQLSTPTLIPIATS